MPKTIQKVIRTLTPYVHYLKKLPKLFWAGVGLIGLGIALLTAFILNMGANQTTKATTSIGHIPNQAVVQVTAGGFVPATLLVAPNTEVTWVNEDVKPHLVAADPYPSHSELPALVSPRALGQKETYSFLFAKTNTVHYHDDLNPMLNGVVQVK